MNFIILLHYFQLLFINYKTNKGCLDTFHLFCPDRDKICGDGGFKIQDLAEQYILATIAILLVKIGRFFLDG